jgi:hypothetical protein
MGAAVEGPGTGLLEACILGEFAFTVAVAFACVASDSLATDFGGGVGTEEGDSAEIVSGACGTAWGCAVEEDIIKY